LTNVRSAATDLLILYLSKRFRKRTLMKRFVGSEMRAAYYGHLEMWLSWQVLLRCRASKLHACAQRWVAFAGVSLQIYVPTFLFGAFCRAMLMGYSLVIARAGEHS
jgi:hypothetical protein